MANTYLILGSNLGNRLQNIETACTSLQNTAGTITGRSSVYESEPWGFESDANFINQVIHMKTYLSPELLLAKVSETEKKAGRIRTRNSGYESRVIDIDILFYDDRVIRSTDLIIPHPRLHLRNFVLEPLMELIPDFIHPGLNKTIRELKNMCEDIAWVRKMN